MHIDALRGHFEPVREFLKASRPCVISAASLSRFCRSFCECFADFAIPVSPLPLYSLPTDIPARLDAGEGEAGREGCYSRVHVFDIVSLSHVLPESGGRGTGVWRASVCVSGGHVCCVGFSWDGLYKGQLEMRFTLLQCYTMYKQSSNLAVGKGERSVSTVE